VPSVDGRSVQQPDSISDSTRRAWERCRDEARNYAESKALSDQLARAYLILIAETVHSPAFSLEELARLRGLLITEKQLKNPYLVLMRAADPARGIKVQSNQSLALIYALAQCRGKVGLLKDYFQKKSIKQCLKELRQEKKAHDYDMDTKIKSRLVIRDFPGHVAGEILVKIEVASAGKARFIAIIDNNGLT